MAVGARKPVPVDIRIISATHRNLKALVDTGQFRQDLYYRLNGVILQLPSLRDREDKAWIIRQIANVVSPDGPLSFSKEAEEALLAYHWPGNVRELMNVLELCVAMSDDGKVEITDLPQHIRP
jgi:transcriptional regulator of acetoin/glycerol metabolism